MTLRVAFTLVDRQRWAGGYQYQINLFRILRHRGEKRISPLLFAGLDAAQEELLPFRSLLDDGIILSPVFNRKNQGRRLLDALFSGKDRKAEAIFQRRHIDVVFGSAVYYGRRFSIPGVAWIPDFQHRQLPELFNLFAYWKRELGFRAQISGGMTVMVSSETARQDCETYFPAVRGSVYAVPFAVWMPQEQLRDDPQEICGRYHLPSSYVYLPNQFWKHKNHETVVEALKLLKGQGREDICVVASGQTRDPRHPGLYEQIQRKVQSGNLEKNFLSLGVIPYGHVLALMRGAVAVMNPSLMEGWSTTVEEAKSLGVPLILSDISVHREQASGIAAFFDPLSPESLAKVLDQSMNCVIELKNRYRGKSLPEAMTRRADLYLRRFTEVLWKAAKKSHERLDP